MKISCNWLKDYIDVYVPPTELADLLTLSGLEVENIESVGPTLEGVVVGYILNVKQHPNADRLTLCVVDLGDGPPVQIVCGAPNVKKEQYVPVATIGCTLTLNGKSVRIRNTKLRGELSMGMICAEDELGLSDDHSGIMVLDDSAHKGESLATYLDRTGYQVRDTVFDIAITPNRPDATCHIGVARDVTALTNSTLRQPQVQLPQNSTDIHRYVSVNIACPDLCRRYVAMIVTGVKVDESPLWLQQRLKAIGLRPINNIVDITNYVMYECGQPLHAFDYDQLVGSQVIIRASRSGEKMTTLDGKSHTLPDDVILICDKEQPVALGGIMGGGNSEVEDTTTTVLIESAWFDPSCTRRSARKLGIQTDASYRFERGVDAEVQVWAAARAAQLIAALGQGTVVDGFIDAHPNPLTLPAITLRLSRIPVILGITIPPKKVVRILEALDFQIRRVGDVLHCQVPSHRPDVGLEIDLIEEVARIYGLDKIEVPGTTAIPGTAPSIRPVDTLRENVDAYLNGRGFHEIYTNSLMGREMAEQFSHHALGTDYPVVETLNAVSKTMSCLRPSLLPGLLKVMQHNTYHSQTPLRFYERGHVFHKTPDAQAAYIEGYSEYESLIFGTSGPVQPQGWDSKVRNADLFDLKGDVESLTELLGLNGVRMEPQNKPTSLTAYQITLYSGNKRLGCIARLNTYLQDKLNLRAPVYFAELNWSRLVLNSQKQQKYSFTPLNRYPVVDRDIAVVLPRSQPVGPLLESIRKAGAPLLLNVNVFDLYKDNRLGETKKSIAFALSFGARRTLRDAEVDKSVKSILKALHELYGAELRS